MIPHFCTLTSIPSALILFKPEDLNRIGAWAEKWLVSFNCNKSKVLIINGPSSTPVSLKLNNVAIKKVDSYKYLGLTFTETLSWHQHIENICIKAGKLITLLLKFSKVIPKTVTLRLYSSYILQFWNMEVLYAITVRLETAIYLKELK